MFDGSGRQDAMAQIENMPIAAAGTAQDVFNAAFDLMERRIQRHRVEIPLPGSIMPDHGPGFVEMDSPVDADHIAAIASLG